MKPLNEMELRYRNSYLAQCYANFSAAKVEAAMPGNAEIADELVELYLSGRKTAGSSLLEDFLATGDPLPTPGKYWIVLDSQGVPQCILLSNAV